MKKLVFTAIVLFSVFSVKAQTTMIDLSVSNQYPDDAKAEEVYQIAYEKQADPKTSAIRNTWVANKPNSNWFFSLEGGGAHLMSEEYRNYPIEDSNNIKPTIGFSLGRWFTPVWGLRLNVTAAELSSYNQDPNGTWYVGDNYWVGNSGAYVKGQAAEVTKRFLTERDGNLYGDFTYAAGTLDFMLNLKNVFRPYNPKGFFNPVVYAGAGFVHTFGDKDKDVTAVNNIATKLGTQLNFRLGDRWDLYLDGQLLVVPETFDRYVGDNNTLEGVLSAKLGLSYRFNFRHFIKAPLVDQAYLDALNTEINELRNRPQVVCPPPVVCPEPEVITVAKEAKVELTPVFFTIDSYVVRDNQWLSIAKAAQYLVDNPNAKIEISAYADKNTGNPAHNLKLSENRAKAVAKVLVSKFGIDKNRLKLSHFGDTTQPFQENDRNRVAIFIQ